jgi:hypothetical protein
MTNEAARNAPELAYLLSRLDQAVHETAAGQRQAMAMVASLFFGLAALYGLAFAQWGIAAFIAAFGLGIVFIGRKASAKTSPEKMRPVMEAVRDAPERITLVRHYQTSDSRRIFVTDWLELKTAEHRLLIKAKHDWHNLYSALQRRCPGAAFVDKA